MSKRYLTRIDFDLLLMSYVMNNSLDGTKVDFDKAYDVHLNGEMVLHKIIEASKLENSEFRKVEQ